MTCSSTTVRSAPGPLGPMDRRAAAMSSVVISTVVHDNIIVANVLQGPRHCSLERDCELRWRRSLWQYIFRGSDALVPVPILKLVGLPLEHKLAFSLSNLLLISEQGQHRIRLSSCLQKTFPSQPTVLVRGTQVLRHASRNIGRGGPAGSFHTRCSFHLRGLCTTDL